MERHGPLVEICGGELVLEEDADVRRGDDLLKQPFVQQRTIDGVDALSYARTINVCPRTDGRARCATHLPVSVIQLALLLPFGIVDHTTSHGYNGR